MDETPFRQLLSLRTRLRLRDGTVEHARWLPWDQLTRSQAARARAHIVEDLREALAAHVARAPLRLAINRVPPALERSLARLRAQDARLGWEEVITDEDDTAPLPSAWTRRGRRPRCVVGRLDELPLARAWADWLELDPGIRGRLCYVYATVDLAAAARLDAVPTRAPRGLAEQTRRAELISGCVWGDQIPWRYPAVLHPDGTGVGDVLCGFHDNLSADEARARLAEGFDLVEASELITIDGQPRDLRHAEREAATYARRRPGLRRVLSGKPLTSVSAHELVGPIGLFPERWCALDRRLVTAWAKVAEPSLGLVLTGHSVFDCHALALAAMGRRASFARAYGLAAANVEHPSAVLWFLRAAVEQRRDLAAALRASEHGEETRAELRAALRPMRTYLRGHAALAALQRLAAD